MQGRLAETEETLRDGIETYPNAYIWSGLLANAYAETGRLDEAEAILEPQLRSDFASLAALPRLPRDGERARLAADLRASPSHAGPLRVVGPDIHRGTRGRGARQSGNRGRALQRR
ncbi:MAG: tetratricopeptide repeat protein [Deltaproteobacteria bacterium]|nr:tetratricopeptide repeat protein [Deltaproteobacteria bacterium]